MGGVLAVRMLAGLLFEVTQTVALAFGLQQQTLQGGRIGGVLHGLGQLHARGVEFYRGSGETRVGRFPVGFTGKAVAAGGRDEMKADTATEDRHAGEGGGQQPGLGASAARRRGAGRLVETGFNAGPQVATRRDRPVEGAHLAQVFEFVHGLSPSARRSSPRARCNCAFEEPTAIPSSMAISSCFQPSTSYRTRTARARGGNAAMAFSSSSRSTARTGLSRSAMSGRCSSSTMLTGSALRARMDMSATFTASRYTQVPNALSKRKPSSFCQARMKASWVRSSARAWSKAARRRMAP